MAIVPIPNIRDLGIVPNNNMDEAEYNAAAESFTGNMPGWGADNKAVGDAGRTNALHAQGAADSATTSATTANQRANDAAASASTASTKASDATTAANAAAASYASMQKLYLGPKPAHPATDNQGQPLQLGAWYTNTTIGYWYWWNGANWIVGVGDLNAVDWETQVINKPLLVNSVNGRSGVVAGLVEQTINIASGTNLDTIRTSGFYRLNGSFTLGGIDVSNGQLIVSSTGGASGSILQIAGHPSNGNVVCRGGDLGGAFAAWQRMLTDRAVIERLYGAAINTSTFAPDLKNGSIHQYTLNVSTTINMPAPRNDGDQFTLLLYQPGSSSVAFSANVRLPDGVTLPAIPSGKLQALLMVALNNVWYTAIGPRWNL